MPRLLTALGVFALLAARASLAHEVPITYDRVQLTSEAVEEVASDELTIILFAQHQAQRQKDAAEAVNGALEWALERARSAAGIEVSTLGYRTQPVYSNRRVTGWRARQSMRLEGRDPAALSELAGVLQERLAIESVRYGLSREARAVVEERLVVRALEGFRARAELVAGQLDRTGYRIVNVNIATGFAPPGPIPMRAMARAADAAPAPPIEPGTQEVRVTVSGTVELE